MNRWIAMRFLLSVTMVATISQAQVGSDQPATQHIVTPQLQRRGPSIG
jgi:hypothetical protein